MIMSVQLAGSQAAGEKGWTGLAGHDQVLAVLLSPPVNNGHAAAWLSEKSHF